MENLSTNASSRRSSFCFQEPSKYNQLFVKGSRITPKDRVDSNIQAIKSLNLKISSGLAASYFFKYGSPQAENDHFKDVFKSFFVEIRGVDPLVQKGAKSLVSQFGRYQDVARIEREGNYPTEKLLEELQEIVRSTYGLRKQLLATLQNGKYTIDDEWDLETRDTWFREFKGIFPIAPLFPKCVEALTDIVSNLLEIEWLNEDVRGIQAYTGQSQKIDNPLVTAHIWGGISVEGVLHLVKYTVGDGSCALHALLGKETLWGFYLEDSRAKLLSKIRERLKEPEVQAALLNILQSHADAQNDASSNILFAGASGQSLKQQYHALKRDYQQQIAALKDSESALWLQEINSLRGLILENIDRSLEHYTGKSDEEIFDIVKGSRTCLRNVIANNDSAFLNSILEEKRISVYEARERIVATLYKEDQAKADFFSQKLFPHYLTILQNDDFYLNTAELELTAGLFNKNMRVIDRDGELITAVNIPNLQEDPVIVYHEGVHFSRCKPANEADPLELESYQSQVEWAEIQELVGHALIRDGQLKTLHGIENKKEAYSLIAAGVLSIWLGGVPLAIQAARSGINIGGRQVDPEGKDKKIQVAKMLSNSAVGKLVGGGGNLAASLGIDLVDILSRPENQNQTTSSIRNLIASSLKGIATKDPKKFAEYFMGGVVGEAANRLPENDANTSHFAGVFKAFAQNPELHGKLVEGALKKIRRNDPKPKTGGELTPEEQEKYPKQIITEVEPEQIIKEPEMHDPEGYQRLLLEEKGLQASLEKAKSDLVTPQSILEQEQQALDEKQAKVDKYAKKGGNRAYEKTLHYEEKRDDHTIKRNVALGNVNNINGRIAELNGKIAENQKSQAVASSPKHIPAPNSGVHIIGDQKTGENHHPYYVENGQKQGLGKYDNAEDARHISGLFTKIETNKLSFEMQCFDAQRQLMEAGFSIDNVPERLNLSMPTILGNDVDANSKTLTTAGVEHKKMVQSYLKGVETLLGKPIETQGLTKPEISDIRQQVTPNIKDPKEHGFWYNAYRSPGKGLRTGLQWLDEHGVSLCVNVDINKPLYKTKTKESTPSYVGNYGYDAPKQRPLSNLGQWENVQATQRDQLFNMNMEYKSPIDNSSQGNLDYQQFWGQGLNPNAQIPPSDWSGLGRNPKEHVIPGMKHYPDGDRTQSNIPKWLRYFASAGETIDPQERIDRNTQSLVATTKVAGQAFGEIADELRSFGCVNAKFDQGRVTLRFDRTISSQIDGLMDQFLPNMDHVPNFRYVEFTARIANDVMLQAFMMPLFQAGKAKPLLDRVLVRPQGFGQQVRAIEAFQQPALRSGLGFPKLGLMSGQPKVLAERNISKIRTDWVLPKKGGATINGRWYTEHALERMAPRTPEVMAELEVRTLERSTKKGYKPQTEAFGDWWKDNKPNPRNIPPSVVEAEISKPGSTNIRVKLNQKGDVITVIPGGKN